MATLFPGQSLHPGQSLQSNNKLHTLILQSDGNVVLFTGLLQWLELRHGCAVVLRAQKGGCSD